MLETKVGHGRKQRYGTFARWAGPVDYIPTFSASDFSFLVFWG
jgi:hypothetical protein